MIEGTQLTLNGFEEDRLNASDGQFPEVDGPAMEISLRDLLQGRNQLLCGLTGAGAIAQLEDAFTRRLRGRRCLAASSGTAALHTALTGCGVTRGDEVIVSAYDWGAATATVLAVGAVPVFADIDASTFTLDPAAAASAVSSRTTAIIATHLFGHPAAMEALVEVAERHGLCVIEDCAQAFGASLHGIPVGAWGEAAAFSFGWGKPLPVGEGGLVAFRDVSAYESAVRFSQHPLRQRKEGIVANSFGLNYRLHPLAALLAIHSWDQAETEIQERRAAADILSQVLSDDWGLRPPIVAPGCEHTFHNYSPSYETDAWQGSPKEAVVRALAAEGVLIAGTIIKQPLYKQAGMETLPHVVTDCPASERRCLEEVAIKLASSAKEMRLEVTATKAALERVRAMMSTHVR